MKRLLLIGAGFSRNWGAPLASEFFGYLLSYPAIGDNARLRDMLHAAQSRGGFEEVLATLQTSHDRDAAEYRKVLETALDVLFQRINRQLFERQGMEFQQDRRFQVREFLGHFDAIFTLNQDVLLEHHYVQHVDLLDRAPRWRNAALPYMRPVNVDPERSWGMLVWTPADDFSAPPAENEQPIYKLHGSTNWRTNDADQLMVLGGAKQSAIQRHPVLARYFQEFRSQLNSGDAKLCIIGYGFRDPHINEELIGAMSQAALKVFLIDPSGTEAYRRVNPTHGAAIRCATPLEGAFGVGLRGQCKRYLNELFGGPNLDHEALLAFLQA